MDSADAPRSSALADWTPVVGEHVQVERISVLSLDLPVGYRVNGFIARPIRSGLRMVVFRYERSGRPGHGHLVTTPVQRIRLLDGGVTVETESGSLYRLTPIVELAPVSWDEANDRYSGLFWNLERNGPPGPGGSR